MALCLRVSNEHIGLDTGFSAALHGHLSKIQSNFHLLNRLVGSTPFLSRRVPVDQFFIVPVVFFGGRRSFGDIYSTHTSTLSSHLVQRTTENE